MEDYVVAEFRKVKDSELGLFAIFDGHLGHDVPNYLKAHLFDNILNEVSTNLSFNVHSVATCLMIWCNCVATFDTCALVLLCRGYSDC